VSARHDAPTSPRADPCGSISRLGEPAQDKQPWEHHARRSCSGSACSPPFHTIDGVVAAQLVERKRMLRRPGGPLAAYCLAGGRLSNICPDSNNNNIYDMYVDSGLMSLLPLAARGAPLPSKAALSEFRKTALSRSSPRRKARARREPEPAMAAQMKRMKCDFMVHGCRSSFRDWAAETGVAFEVAEQCLAHATGSAVIRDYLRTSMLERRRPVLTSWADFVTGSGISNVIPIRA
jgi:hypothetical protein